VKFHLYGDWRSGRHSVLHTRIKRPAANGCDRLLIEAVTEAFDYVEATGAAIDSDFRIEHDCAFDSSLDGLRSVRWSNFMSDSRSLG
jgi:hypothetical protein